MKLRYVLLTAAFVTLLVSPSFAQGTLFVEGDNVGIGTATPQLPFHIVRPPGSDPSVIRLEQAGPSRIEFRDTANNVNWDFRTTSGDAFVITKVGNLQNELLVNSIGDIVIPGSLKARGGDGSIDPGDIFPDYVFEPDYPLMNLGELSQFIDREKHLPDVLSVDEVRKEGSVNMTKLQLQLLKKVEELTLYILDQDRQIQELRARLDGTESHASSDRPE